MVDPAICMSRAKDFLLDLNTNYKSCFKSCSKWSWRT